ncbi:CPBP family intramembrane glutamic endopeptidase [Salisaeta longa]|uniref:CPBP family intramembrane glutamic endopeptidase n=1 Tax=Salisaeta longa TaxID=503170 RepID=UPI0003B53477|nr:CPBP family intramembrane glutamic endopeptidase [Salisaeta longa]
MPNAERRPVLPDAWAAAGRIPLNGPLERVPRGALFSAGMGMFGLLASFVFFQVLVAPVALAVQVMASGGLDALQQMASPDALLNTYTTELIISNSVGQVLGLAAAAVALARLHTTEAGALLRMRGVDLRLVGGALAGLVALTPVVQWLGQVNQSLPLPDALRALEQTQLQLIAQVLNSGLGVGFNLVMLAVVPALCEELIFRGYAQRQFERAFGAVGGIVVVGLLFGMYHVRPSQFLPLALLGIYLAYLTWRTGSLWPAIAVHFANNAFAVAAAEYVQQHPAYDMQTVQQMSIPWYGVLSGFVFFCGIAYVLHRYAAQRRPHSSPSS